MRSTRTNAERDVFRRSILTVLGGGRGFFSVSLVHIVNFLLILELRSRRMVLDVVFQIIRAGQSLPVARYLAADHRRRKQRGEDRDAERLKSFSFHRSHLKSFVCENLETFFAGLQVHFRTSLPELTEANLASFDKMSKQTDERPKGRRLRVSLDRQTSFR